MIKQVNKEQIKNIIYNPDNKKYTNQFGIDFKVKSLKDGIYLEIDSYEYDLTMDFHKQVAVDFINDYSILEDEAESLPTVEDKDDKHLQVKVGVSNFS